MAHARHGIGMYVLAMDGYRLDLVSDCDVITLRRADDSAVCRFGMYATERAIQEAIAEDEGRRVEAIEEVYAAQPGNMGVIPTEREAVEVSEQNAR